MRDYSRQKEKIINYFQSNEKKEQLKLGIEFEHFVLNNHDFSAVSYYEEKGIVYILRELVKKGWEAKYEGEHLLGVNRGYCQVTIEPGGQFELSVGPLFQIEDIDNEYIKFLKDVIPIIEKNKQILVSLGYQAKSKITDIPFIPKERYKYMSKYLNKKGKYALNMMKATSSLQVSIDYINEEDFIKKFKVANALSPILSALFDNSPFFEGMLWDKNCVRTLIWDNCDSERSGILTALNDDVFDYGKYAEYILNVPPILTKKGKSIEYTGDKKFKEIFNVDKYDREELEHMLTMVFPDVRAKQFIEIRMCDAVPYPYNVAMGALIKGLMYNEEILDKVEKITNVMNAELLQKARKQIINKGMKALYGDRPIYEVAQELLDLAKDGLGKEEAKYLEPVFDIVEKRTSLSQEIKDKLGCDMEKALEKQIVNNFKQMHNTF